MNGLLEDGQHRTVVGGVIPASVIDDFRRWEIPDGNKNVEVNCFDSTGTRGVAFGKSNVIPEHMTVSGDLRVISPLALADAKERMQAIAGQTTRGTSAALVFDDGYPPMAPAPGNLSLLAEFDRASRHLGFGAVGMDNPARAGAADVSFIAATVPSVIDGLGPGGTGGHTVNETVNLRTIPMQIARTAVLLNRITRGAPVP